VGRQVSFVGSNRADVGFDDRTSQSCLHNGEPEGKTKRPLVFVAKLVAIFVEQGPLQVYSRHVARGCVESALEVSIAV